MSAPGGAGAGGGAGASAGSTTATDGASRVVLHPLAILSAADHHTRLSVGSSSSPQRAIGMLFGEPGAASTAVLYTYELTYEVEGSSGIELDQESAEVTLKLSVSDPYPAHKLVGVYVVGKLDWPADAQWVGQLSKMCPQPLIMQMDDDVVAGAKSVPITFLTPVGSGALDKAALEVIDFKIDASAMERVTIDHIARAVTRSDEGSQMASTLRQSGDALGAVTSRVDTILTFLEATKRGDIAENPAMLRRVAELCTMLPAAGSDKLTSKLQSNHNDELLVTALATITKSMHRMQEALQRVHVASESRAGLGRVGAGGML